MVWSVYFSISLERGGHAILREDFPDDSLANQEMIK